MAPGIAGLELEATGEAVVCSHGQPIVVGVGNVLRVRHHPEAASGMWSAEFREGRLGCKGVQGGVGNFFMRTVIADIHCAQSCVPANCLLHFQAPFVIGRNLDGRGVVEVEGSYSTSCRVVRLEAGVRSLRQLIQSWVVRPRLLRSDIAADAGRSRGSSGAFCRKLSIAPVGRASENTPNPPRRTVFCDPPGDQAKPIFGCQADAVTEGKA